MVFKAFLFIALLFCCFSFAESQTATPAAGGELRGSGGTASFTIGQTVYKTHSSATASASDGVQQVYGIEVIGIDDNNSIELECKAFPNPVHSELTLRLGDGCSDPSLFTYKLFALGGQQLEEKKLSAKETQIDVSTFASGTYFLKVLTGNKEVKVFKFVKN